MALYADVCFLIEDMINAEGRELDEVREEIYMSRLATEQLDKKMSSFMKKYQIQQVPTQDYHRMIKDVNEALGGEIEKLRVQWGDKYAFNLAAKVDLAEYRVALIFGEVLSAFGDLVGLMEDDLILLRAITSQDEQIEFIEGIDGSDSELLKEWHATYADIATYDDAQQRALQVAVGETLTNDKGYDFAAMRHEAIEVVKGDVTELLYHLEENPNVKAIDEHINNVIKLLKQMRIINAFREHEILYPFSRQLFHQATNWFAFDLTTGDTDNTIVVFAKVRLD